MKSKEPMRGEAPVEVSSPPCQMHETAPEYAGYLARNEIVDLLNLLLEGERAGVRAAALLRKMDGTAATNALVRTVAGDEASCCALLERHISRLGGTPSRAVGQFFDKFAKVEGLEERLAFLNKGQEWVVRRLQQDLPRIDHESLRHDLEVMLAIHERNVAECADVLARGAQAR